MTERIDRRRFLALAAGGVALGALVVLQGCGGSGGGDSTPTTPETPETPETPTYSDERGSVSSNHGHSVTLTAAQQEAGAAVTLGLSSGDGHTHSVKLSAEDVAAVAAGSRVSRTSTTDAGHNHRVTFN